MLGFSKPSEAVNETHIYHRTDLSQAIVSPFPSLPSSSLSKETGIRKLTLFKITTFFFDSYWFIVWNIALILTNLNAPKMCLTFCNHHKSLKIYYIETQMNWENQTVVSKEIKIECLAFTLFWRSLKYQIIHQVYLTYLFPNWVIYVAND